MASKMYDSFADCIQALTTDSRFCEAQGGLVLKVHGGFAYSLHGESKVEGEPFVDVGRSIAPGETWTAKFLNWPEAEQAYQELVREFPITIED